MTTCHYECWKGSADLLRGQPAADKLRPLSSWRRPFSSSSWGEVNGSVPPSFYFNFSVFQRGQTKEKQSLWHNSSHTGLCSVCYLSVCITLLSTEVLIPWHCSSCVCVWARVCVQSCGCQQFSTTGTEMTQVGSHQCWAHSTFLIYRVHTHTHTHSSGYCPTVHTLSTRMDFKRAAAGVQRRSLKQTSPSQNTFQICHHFSFASALMGWSRLMR